MRAPQPRTRRTGSSPAALVAALVASCRFLAVVAALVAASAVSAVAADKYPCTDTDNNGSFDVACTGNDPNRNGILNDGLETTPLAFVGMWTPSGCSAGQYRRLTAANTFTSCVDPTVSVQCEATGAGVCKYINPTTGSNTTGNGSYANPWQTWEMVSHFANPINRPVGWYALQPGDVVYQVGGTADVSYSTGETPGGTIPLQAIAMLAAAGTSSNPITARAYPGTHAVMDSGNAHTCLGTSPSAEWIRFYDFELENCHNNPITLFGDDLLVEGLEIHDSDMSGSGGSSNGGVKFATTARAKFYRNRVYNLYDSIVGTSNENVAIGVAFDSPDLDVSYNYFYHTCDPTAGGCSVMSNSFKVKGGFDSGSGMSGFTFKGNSVWHMVGGGVRNATADSVIHSNFIRDTTGPCVDISDMAHGYYPKNNSIEHNTCIRTTGCLGVKWSQASSSARVGALTWKDNVCVDRATAYDNESNTMRLDAYATQAGYYDVVMLGGLFDADRNCYWRNNGTASASTSQFACVSCYGYNPPGAWMSFSAYATSTGVGEGSSAFVNPALDTYERASASQCVDFGAEPYSGPDPTPEPTASPSPSPTPSPTPIPMTRNIGGLSAVLQ